MSRIELKLGSVITLDKRIQQMTSFGSEGGGGECVIYILDIIISISHVLKIKLFCQRDIRRHPQ